MKVEYILESSLSYLLGFLVVISGMLPRPEIFKLTNAPTKLLITRFDSIFELLTSHITHHNERWDHWVQISLAEFLHLTWSSPHMQLVYNIESQSHYILTIDDPFICKSWTPPSSLTIFFCNLVVNSSEIRSCLCVLRIKFLYPPKSSSFSSLSSSLVSGFRFFYLPKSPTVLGHFAFHWSKSFLDQGFAITSYYHERIWHHIRYYYNHPLVLFYWWTDLDLQAPQSPFCTYVVGRIWASPLHVPCLELNLTCQLHLSHYS